jgi:hypothetical protein
MARFNFNPSEYEDDQGGGNYEPIPEGEYEMMCEEAEEKQTSSGGLMIKAKFRVLGPTNANRVVYNNFNIINNSEKAQEIGRRQLSTWARAVGRPNAADTDELLNMPFIGIVGIEPARGEYKAQNRINGYKSKSGNVSTPAPRPAPAPAQSAAPTPAAAPATPPAAASPAAASPSKPAASSTNSGRKAPWDD